MGSAQRIAVHYVIAPSQSEAERLAELVWAGTIPPISHSAADAIRLAGLHPGGMILQPRPYQVYTGLARPRSKLLEPDNRVGENAWPTIF